MKLSKIRNGLICKCCGRALNPERTEWLHLNSTTNLYSNDENFPTGESQGWFEFGKSCAKKVLANGGKLCSTET